jgi:hypothetical protein
MTDDTLFRLTMYGFSESDARSLRRAARTLNTWSEHERNGRIERSELTGLPYWVNPFIGKRGSRTADRETDALRRIAEVMQRYPKWVWHHQGGPRGASLYLIPPNRVQPNRDIDTYYSVGIAIY